MNWSVKNNKRKNQDNDNDESPINLLDLLSNKSSKSKEPSGDNIYTIDNNIYFQDDITLDTITTLNKEIRLMSSFLITMGNDYSIPPPPIRLHITSYGGSVHAALSAIDCIEESKVPVHTIIDGYAASAATMISVCGAKRYIKKNASMLIHQLRAGTWGKMSDIEDEYINLQKTHELIKKIYINKTRLKKSNIAKILKHDLDWDADECLANGLVDEIL
jgi:ATP-dependent protease ClpP protease subunit